jgi:hypothetical protein
MQCLVEFAQSFGIVCSLSAILAVEGILQTPFMNSPPTRLSRLYTLVLPFDLHALNFNQLSP